MGADYSIELIFIETYAPQFIGHNKIFLGSVIGQCNTEIMLSSILRECHDFSVRKHDPICFRDYHLMEWFYFWGFRFHIKNLEFHLPYARHYKPRLVYFFTPFLTAVYIVEWLIFHVHGSRIIFFIFSL